MTWSSIIAAHLALRLCLSSSRFDDSISLISGFIIINTVVVFASAVSFVGFLIQGDPAKRFSTFFVAPCRQRSSVYDEFVVTERKEQRLTQSDATDIYNTTMSSIAQIYFEILCTVWKLFLLKDLRLQENCES